MIKFWKKNKYRTLVELIEYENFDKKIILNEMYDMGFINDDLRPFRPISKRKAKLLNEKLER